VDGTYANVAELPLRIDSYELEGLELDGGGWPRRTTVIRLHGAGHEGVGEDVTYDSDEQLALQQAGPVLPLTGAHTVETFSRLLEGLDLFPKPASWEGAIAYRRWGYEAAALDLALRQADLSLAAALEMEARPVRFCASMGLGEPPTADVVRRWLEFNPALRFKLDATMAWDDALVAELAATGAVDVVDLKGHYATNWIDFPADPDLYRRVAEGLPDALIEDARLEPETDAVLLPHRSRLTWDAPIHSVDDIRGLPFAPQVLNFKPSRFGSVRGLFAAYDYCRAEGISGYGGGQFELGPGRGQIQHLASLFHADAANDVAPSVYNEGVAAGLPTSPLPPPTAPTGFR
jgi:hypothetical protein